MDKKVFYSELEKVIEGLSDDEVVSLYNAYAEKNGGTPIFYMWEVEKFTFPHGSSLKLDDYYFVLSDTGMPRSFCELSDPYSPFDMGKLIDAIYEQKCSCGFEEVQALLDQVE